MLTPITFRTHKRCMCLALGLLLVGVQSLPVAANQVIFEENFALRDLETSMFGRQPNITNTNNAHFLPSPVLAPLSEFDIREWTFGIKGAVFHPVGQHSDPDLPGEAEWDQIVYLPFDYTFGSDPVRLTLVARQEQARWNNFVFGFVNNTGGMQHWILLQTNAGITQTNVQIFYPDQVHTTPVSPAIFAEEFRTIVMEYDPNLANTPGQNPFTLSITSADGSGGSIPLSGDDLPAISSIGGIGFGFFFSDGFDRSVLVESLKFEILTAPEPQPGDFNGDGVVDAADYVWWRKFDGSNQAGYDEWRMNFGAGSPGSGSSLGSGVAVPEPFSAGLAAIAAVFLGTCRRRRALG